MSKITDAFRAKKPLFLVIILLVLCAAVLLICLLAFPSADRKLIKEAYSLASSTAFVNEVCISKKGASVVRFGDTAVVLFPGDPDIKVAFEMKDGEVYRTSVKLDEKLGLDDVITLAKKGEALS